MRHLINANYGICIPGEGEVAAVTQALVTPGDAAMVTQLGEELLDREEEAVIAADLLDERAALIEERKATKRATNQDQKARRRAHRERVRARRRGVQDEVTVSTTSP